MPFDKRELFDTRGFRCECGCGKPAHDAHHSLIHRMKKYPELDCEENINLVNHDEHVALRKFDTQTWREYFWQVQVDRYGYDHMIEWVNNLPAKIRPRLDWLVNKSYLKMLDELGSANTGLDTIRKA